MFFSHDYRLTAYPIAAGAVILACLSPPNIARRGSRFLDVAILATLAAIAVQLVPLDLSVREAISPAAAAFDRRMILAADARSAHEPISVFPAGTMVALVFGAALAIVFWSMQRGLRRAAAGSGSAQRWFARIVAGTGLLVAPVSVVHHLNVIPILDEVWSAARRDLRPWGPFVNRNDFAGWMLVACGLTLGYVIARLEAHHHEHEPFDPGRAFDATGTRMAAALVVMAGAIMFSLSRSGLLGAVVGALLFFLIGRRRLAPDRRKGLALAVVALIVGSAVFVNVAAFSVRLESAMSEGMTGRLSIWSQTWPIVRDFWPVGTGVGAYARVMTLYQTSTRLITISHADNEPLQMAAEGGLLVGLPALLVAIAFVGAATRRLREDRSRMFWIRAGAVSGLAAIAAQNMVEMTLRVPATALLAVAVAAVAVHERPGTGLTGV